MTSGEIHALPPQPGTDGYDTSVAWSPNGRWLALGTCCGPSRLSLIDVATDAVVTLDPTGSDYGYTLSWSPDSQRIATVQKREVRGVPPPALVTWSVDGTDQVEVVAPSGKPGTPYWSPDGSWIAFEARAERGGTVDYPNAVLIVRPDGTDRHQLAAPIANIVGWDPDGTSIAYTVPSDGGPQLELRHVSIADGATRPVAVPAGASGFAWAIQRDSEPVAAVPTAPVATAQPAGETPAAPPSGAAIDPRSVSQALAFFGRASLSSGDDRCDVLLVRLPDDIVSVGRDPNAPVDQPGGCYFSTQAGYRTDASQLWSPDGSAYARVVYGTPETLEIIGADGRSLSGPTPIGSGDVAWSPDGTWVSTAGCPGAVVCTTGSLLFRVGGTDPRHLPGGPAWSQDGRHIAVETADGTLMVGGPDGSDLKAIGAYPLPSGWAPDGQRLIFVRNGNVWIVDADGTRLRNLTNLELGGTTSASWSPDGRWIAFLQGDGLWAVDPDGEGTQRLGGGFTPGSAPVWSPDGTRLAALHGQDVILFEVGAWHPVLLADGRSPVWTTDGRYLAVVADGDGQPSIDLMNADGSGRRSVWRTPYQGGAIDGPIMWVP